MPTEEPGYVDGLPRRTKRHIDPWIPTVIMSASTDMALDRSLTDKQRRILAYLREEVGTRTYFKSRLIAREIGMTAKEVGTNMVAIRDGDYDVDVSEWGYSSSTTWEVTASE